MVHDMVLHVRACCHVTGLGVNALRCTRAAFWDFGGSSMVVVWEGGFPCHSDSSCFTNVFAYVYVPWLFSSEGLFGIPLISVHVLHRSHYWKVRELGNCLLFFFMFCHRAEAHPALVCPGRCRESLLLFM
jgi:hypothetical protein